MGVFQIITFEAAPGKADEVAAMVEQARDFALTVDGCEAYSVYQGTDEPSKFVMVERWTSQEKHEAHFQKNVIESGVLDRVMALMTGPPQFAYYVER